MYKRDFKYLSKIHQTCLNMKRTFRKLMQKRKKIEILSKALALARLTILWIWPKIHEKSSNNIKIDSVRAVIEIIFFAFMYLINRCSTYYHTYSLKTDGDIFMINRENRFLPIFKVNFRPQRFIFDTICNGQ